MSQALIETATGVAFDILKPTVEMVHIEDIAHALSQMNRFTGHCRFPYPVSQHSRFVSHLVPDEFALWGLLHDASEAYIGDMNRPMKHFSTAGEAYCRVEKHLMNIICDKFELNREEPEAVKEADDLMLYAEKQQLMPCKMEWTVKWSESEKAADVKIVETPFRDNKQLFLNRFYQLYNK